MFKENLFQIFYFLRYLQVHSNWKACKKFQREDVIQNQDSEPFPFGFFKGLSMARNHCFSGVHKSFLKIKRFVSKLKIHRVRRSGVSVFFLYLFHVQTLSRNSKLGHKLTSEEKWHSNLRLQLKFFSWTKQQEEDEKPPSRILVVFYTPKSNGNEQLVTISYKLVPQKWFFEGKIKFQDQSEIIISHSR